MKTERQLPPASLVLPGRLSSPSARQQGSASPPHGARGLTKGFSESREVPGTEAAIQRSDCHALHPVSFSLHLTQAHADYSWGRGFGRRVSKTPQGGSQSGHGWHVTRSVRGRPLRPLLDAQPIPGPHPVDAGTTTQPSLGSNQNSPGRENLSQLKISTLDRTGKGNLMIAESVLLDP